MAAADHDLARLPFRAVCDLADAQRVVAAYAARVHPLVADLAPASADARLLRAVLQLDAALRGARCLDADAADATDADWDAILELATRVMLLRDDAGAVRLALDVGASAAGAHQYDVADAVLCVRAAAVAALLALYLAP